MANWKTKCWQCGKFFRAGSRAAHYCTGACRQAAYRQRQRQPPLKLDWSTAPIIRAGMVKR